MRKLVLIAVLAGITARGSSAPQQSGTSSASNQPNRQSKDPFLCSLVTSAQQCSEPEIASKCQIKCSHVISKPVISESQAATTQRPDVIPTEDECGIKPQHNFMNGIKVSPSDWPSLAVLVHRITNGSCFGTLITKQHVISTVSCFRTVSRNDRNVKHWLVRLGAFNTAIYVYEAQDFTIMDVRIRDYNYKTQENDIIIVKLDKPLHSFTESIRAACLPYHLRNDTLEGSNLRVVGSILGDIDETIFGNNAQYHNGKLPVLQMNVPVVAVRECQDKYQRITNATKKKVDDTQLCAGPYSINQCLVYGSNLNYYAPRDNDRYYVVGLVSFGPSKCGPNSLPDVYTRIGYHLDWIEESITQLSLSTNPQDDPFGESTAIDGCSSDSDCAFLDCCIINRCGDCRR